MNTNDENRDELFEFLKNLLNEDPDIDVANYFKDAYIPDEVIAGFQKRPDTFTGNLAYLTFDQYGKRKNEKSWNQWISKDIGVQKIANVPTKGFVFNKGIKRINYMNFGSEKIRVYDARGVEFEINVSNLVMILQSCEISKGEIQDECIYAWINGTLNLVPLGSELYRECVLATYDHLNKQSVTVDKNNLVVSGVYASKKNNKDQYVFLGVRDLFQEPRSREQTKKILGNYYSRVSRKEFSVPVFAYIKNGRFKKFMKCDVKNLVLQRVDHDIQRLESKLETLEKEHNNLKTPPTNKYFLKKVNLDSSQFCDFYKRTDRKISDIREELTQSSEAIRVNILREKHTDEEKQNYLSALEEIVGLLEDDLFCVMLYKNGGLISVGSTNQGKFIQFYRDFKTGLNGREVTFGNFDELYHHIFPRDRILSERFVFVRNGKLQELLYSRHNMFKSDGDVLLKHKSADIKIVVSGNYEYVGLQFNSITSTFEKQINLIPVQFEMSDKIVDILWSFDAKNSPIINMINECGYVILNDPLYEDFDNPPDGYQIIEI